MIEISTEARRLDVALIHGFLTNESHWARGIPLGIVERALANSLCFGAYEEGRQIGLARVVTDYATFAWLADVFVAEAARGRGIATALVRAMFEHSELQTIRRWVLGTRDAHDVYAPFGFTPADPKIFMVHAPDPTNWSE